MHLPQGKWWWAAMMAITTPVLNCSLVLPPTPAPSLICLNQCLNTASPSCLGGGWSSVGEALDLVTLTHASTGLQATPAGLTSPR